MMHYPEGRKETTNTLNNYLFDEKQTVKIMIPDNHHISQWLPQKYWKLTASYFTPMIMIKPKDSITVDGIIFLHLYQHLNVNENCIIKLNRKHFSKKHNELLSNLWFFSLTTTKLKTVRLLKFFMSNVVTISSIYICKE